MCQFGRLILVRAHQHPHPALIMKKTCFVISPFGAPFDEYYEKIFCPALAKADIEPVRGNDVYGTGAIIEDIFTAIESAAMVLCDVTGKNPNVNYELGVAHALLKPAVIVTQSVDDVPFDYRHLRAVVYDRAKVDWAKQLEIAIHKTVLSVLSNPARALAWRPKERSTTTISADLANSFEQLVISYSPNPSVATLRFRNQFVVLEARCGDVHPGFRGFFEEIYFDIQALENRVSNKEFVQLRRIWQDDKNGAISIYVDLIHDASTKPSLSKDDLLEALHDGYGWYAHQGIHVEARVLKRNIWSDSFFANGPEFYKTSAE